MDLRRAKVLLVDDNPHSLDLMAQVLRGFRVAGTVPCRSIAEARENFSTQAFDLLIIDAEMPEEDGISLTLEVRSQPRLPNFTAPIILVSAHTPAEKVQRARDAGANLVVKKPIAPAILLDRLEWLARETRDFVKADGYCGPDRRYKNRPLPSGQEERRAGALALTSDMDRKMSQDDIDALFG
jgi:CheY-like chemotaxis protein